MRISSFIVLVILAICCNTFAQDRLPTLEDEQYKTACGPIACFIALQTLGVDTTLDETAQKCGWMQDEFLPLENLRDALRSYRGVDCQITKLTPTEHCKLLKDDQTVVILALRKLTDTIDHAVCAIGVQDNDQVVHLIDYPELHQRKLIGEIADQWDGPALVVRIAPLNRAFADFAVLFFPTSIFIVAVLWFRSRKPKGGTP